MFRLNPDSRHLMYDSLLMPAGVVNRPKVVTINLNRLWSRRVSA